MPNVQFTWHDCERCGGKLTLVYNHLYKSYTCISCANVYTDKHAPAQEVSVTRAKSAHVERKIRMTK